MNDPAPPVAPASPMERLRAIMARLRDPTTGCPWDSVQTFATIAPYTIEEAYEVADAIALDDLEALRDELGDLLFQVVFHARMAEELGAFDLDAVATAISDKMVRRHPHLFGRDAEAASDAASWEAHKAAERAAKARAAGRVESVLDGVPSALPALTRAEKLQRRAARVGFDWPAADDVLDKIAEELDEIAEARAAGDQAHVADEVGDLLFAVANLARKLHVDPETALRNANFKFERRFRAIETALAAEGRRPEESSLDDMEALWRDAKRREL
ncbi:MAG: nucleoside triphosphate pyrophosphohydrolase [Alphaproteobacteria bacterium]|nr:nucleoside triphosphate pyrophosphohydrolase [Alphaproteobacteria bacterium]